MQEVGGSAFFAGTFTHKIDKKGRISIPARWRTEFKAESSPHLYVAAPSGDGAIECVTQADLRRRNTEQTGRTDLSQRQRGLLGLHHFHAYSALPIDPEGRVQLPADALVTAGLAVRDAAARAKTRNVQLVTSEAGLLGAGDRFFIVHPGQVEGILAAASAEADSAQHGQGPEI